MSVDSHMIKQRLYQNFIVDIKTLETDKKEN